MGVEDLSSAGDLLHALRSSGTCHPASALHLAVLLLSQPEKCIESGDCFQRRWSILFFFRPISLLFEISFVPKGGYPRTDPPETLHAL